MRKTRFTAVEIDAAPPRLPQIESTRLYRQIAELLTTRIEQGLFPVGSFLPAERELADQLAVSRTTVREALIALEISGQVEIRHGHGVQVVSSSQKSSGSGTIGADIGPIQIMEARRVLEPKSAELAATNHTPVNLERMRAAMALQAKATTAAATQYREGDRRFHLEIARASGNPAYEVLVSKLWEYRAKPLFKRFEQLLVGPERPAMTATEHETIFKAIAEGDATLASRAMRKHIDAVLQAFINGGQEKRVARPEARIRRERLGATHIR
jgi:DNA-binding FadR family transcriptional regulator